MFDAANRADVQPAKSACPLSARAAESLCERGYVEAEPEEPADDEN